MTRNIILMTLGLFVIGAFSPQAMAENGATPQYDQLGAARAQGENPTYHVNRYGYGNYVQGPNGSYGGYPAGSAGAIELQNEHRIKCRDMPESC